MSIASTQSTQSSKASDSGCQGQGRPFPRTLVGLAKGLHHHPRPRRKGLGNTLPYPWQGLGKTLPYSWEGFDNPFLPLARILPSLPAYPETPSRAKAIAGPGAGARSALSWAGRAAPSSKTRPSGPSWASRAILELIKRWKAAISHCTNAEPYTKTVLVGMY